MILSISGFGYSGSGAVLDFLKEIEGLQVFDRFELNILFVPDGIHDLEYHLCKEHFRFMSGDFAVRRFLRRIDVMSKRFDLITNKQFSVISKEYIFEMVQIKWIGNSFIHQSEYSGFERFVRYRLCNKIKKIYEKVTMRLFNFPPNQTMYFCIEPEDFMKKTQKYLYRVLESLGADFNKIVVLNQFVSADNPIPSLRYIDDMKAIIVQRDPRDIYLLLKVGLKEKIGFVPVNDVSGFVTYYKRLMVNSKISSHNDILVIQFEDMIYRYKETTEKILKFLHIKFSKGTMRYFNPDISKQNTQLFNKYPEFAEDVSYIEEQLSEYIYDFSVFETFEHTNKEF